MAMRRPRIKAVANIQLNSKRKTKSGSNIKTAKVNENDEKRVEKQVHDVPDTQILEGSKNVEIVSEVFRVEPSDDTNENECSINDDKHENQNNLEEQVCLQKFEGNAESNVKDESNKNLEEITMENDNLNKGPSEKSPQNVYEESTITVNDSDAFKCPPKVLNERSISHTSNSGIDDVFYSDIEENAMQMDLEKSSNSCMSPSKNLGRQRIRPMPHFGQRRNSFVGSSPSPHTSVSEESSAANNNVVNDSVQSVQPRRERHYSASSTGNLYSSHHQNHHTSHKYFPIGVSNTSRGRIRTESGCSVFSDINNSPKSRKAEDHKSNYRKDYKIRFLNRIPEKSTIKMVDLIYYNPVTNPMEQKPNPNVKLEESETLSNDVKPITETLKNDSDSPACTEDTLVPQLKLNAKGELILDDKSLIIETTAEQEARKVLANSSLIYLDENTGMNGFYSRKKRTHEWMPSDTIKFYRCLQNIGTDFSLMVPLFPNRTRRELKFKFKKEERRNPNLVNKALLYPKQFDIESLKKQLSEEEKQREERAKKISNERCKEQKKRKVSNISIAKRVLVNEDVYQNENGQESELVRKTKNNNAKSEDIVRKKESHKTNAVPKNYLNEDKSDDIIQNENETVNNQSDCLQLGKGKEITDGEKKQSVKKKRKLQHDKLNEGETIASKNSISNDNSDIHANVVRRRRKRTEKFQRKEVITIKEENIKDENIFNQTFAEIEYQDTKQVQTEINELLADLETQQNITYEASTTNFFPLTSEPLVNKNLNPVPCPDDDYIDDNTDMRTRVFVNLDDNTLVVKDDINCMNIVSPVPDLSSNLSRSLSPISCAQPLTPIETETLESTTREPETINDDVCSSVIPERELNEDDIQSILTELAEGSLVLVSSLDPDDPDKVLNEIFMVDKNTGELCEEPLNIPDNIVQCILTLVG